MGANNTTNCNLSLDLCLAQLGWAALAFAVNDKSSSQRQPALEGEPSERAS